ncbi:MAG TPA: DUF302 domain-containing protein [Hanamia sp.]|nr:DUF302 domain-containing protein [Hanamia sp.]
MNGLITTQSDYSVKETIDRVASIVQSKGLTVFARIDHGDNAAKQGLQLRPTELIIFGNPKAGTVLMQDKQTSGIDLPVKALAWQDEEGKVWLTYNDTNWIANRHGLSEKSASVIKAIEEGMALVTNGATKK